MTEIIRDEITTADAWKGAEIQHQTDWTWHLTGAEIEEIEAALHTAKAAGATIPFSKNLFPLPTVQKRLDKAIQEISHGRGCVMVRGLSRDNFSDEDCELIYWGIGIHLGTPVSQNKRGHLLGHVTDEGKDLSDPDARAYQTRNKLDFHCDQLPVDILGLMCLRGAKIGGASYLVSAPMVHNVVLRERPDLLEYLYQPLHIDWRGDQPPGEQPWYDVPMFSAKDGRISARVTSRAFIESVVRYGDELAINEKQREAVDVVQEIANRPEMRLSMEFQEGDFQFISNHSIMHAREAYEDFDDPALKRHLLRMWIGLPDHLRRPLSPLLDHRYDYVKIGGIPKHANA